MTESKEIGGLRRIGVILVFLVLLPALFYSAYEINALTDTEQIIAGTYRQQLEAILFSVNQYAWDVVSGWAATIGNTLRDSPPEQLGMFLQNNAALMGVAVTDSAVTSVRLISPPSAIETLNVSMDRLREIIAAEPGRIGRLIRLQQSDYRKIEPVIIPNALSSGQSALLLLFVADAGKRGFNLVGMIAHSRGFLENVLGQKLREAAGDDFILAVVQEHEPHIAFTTAPGAALTGEQKKALWVFPEYSLSIQLKGTTIEQIAQSRFNRNLTLIVILDVILLAGAWIVYRTLRKEMELVRLKSDFVSNVSHELRTPLALIRMFAETLEMNRVPTEDKKREYYTTILRETERLTRLVNNILNFSRMEAGRKPYNLQPSDLNVVVQEVLATYEQHLTQNGFSLVTGFAPSLPAIAADVEAVSESLINILDNAVKYSADDKRLLIRTGTSDGHVFVDVQDHGIGIAPAEQRRIFEKFYRSSGSLVHNTKGSGLGLTLVRHIMNAHGGAIEVLRSQPGNGSTFRLTFPRLNSR